MLEYSAAQAATCAGLMIILSGIIQFAHFNKSPHSEDSTMCSEATFSCSLSSDLTIQGFSIVLPEGIFRNWNLVHNLLEISIDQTTTCAVSAVILRGITQLIHYTRFTRLVVLCTVLCGYLNLSLVKWLVYPGISSFFVRWHSWDSNLSPYIFRKNH